jgi:hypothetical protein
MEDAEEFLRDLVKRGLGKWEPIPTTSQGGHPSRELVLIDMPDTRHNLEIPEEEWSSVGSDLEDLPDELDPNADRDDFF